MITKLELTVLGGKQMSLGRNGMMSMAGNLNMMTLAQPAGRNYPKNRLNQSEQTSTGRRQKS